MYFPYSLQTWKDCFDGVGPTGYSRNHVPAVFVGFSFECGWSAEFHRGASHKGLVPCSILNKHCSFDLRATGVRLFPPRRQREQADGKEQEKQQEDDSSSRGGSFPFPMSNGDLFCFPLDLRSKYQCLSPPQLRLQGQRATETRKTGAHHLPDVRSCRTRFRPPTRLHEAGTIPMNPWLGAPWNPLLINALIS